MRTRFIHRGRLLLAIITPYEDVPSLRMLMGAIATQPVIDVILAAALTWASSSPNKRRRISITPWA